MNSRTSGAVSDLLSRIRHTDLRRFSLTALCAALLVVGLFYGYRFERTAAEEAARRQTLADLRALDVALHQAQEAGAGGPHPEATLASIGAIVARARETLPDWHGADRWGWFGARISQVLPVAVRDDVGIMKLVYVHLEKTAQAVQWWGSFQPAIADLAIYDAGVDLQGISVSQDRQELLRRMYLAKGGLDRARARMRESLEFAADPDGLQDIISQADALTALVIRLITAADRRLSEQADILQADYRDSMGLLQKSVRAYALTAYQEDPLSERGRASAALLKQLAELEQ